MAKQLNARIITKHDIESNWQKALTFIPKLGEIIIYETPEKIVPNQYDWTSIPRLKIGNGKGNINEIPFITDAYVQKKDGWDLSENNYTDTHWGIVNKIANLDYEPQYTDTTYEAGKGLGLKTVNGKNTFYNTGIISIQGSDANGKIKYRLNTGINDSDYEDIEIAIPGLQDTAFTPLSNFLTSDSLVKINNSITTLEASTIPGSLKYTNAVGESRLVAIPGLGKLAFKDGFDGDFIEVVEVSVQDKEPDEKVPIWINPNGENDLGILKYFNTEKNKYVDLATGVKQLTSIIKNNLQVGFISTNDVSQTTEYNFGIITISKKEEKPGTLIINNNGIEEELALETNLIFSSGTQRGNFQVVQNGVSQNIPIYGLGTNAFTSTEYFPTAGGTITGVTVFSNTTASTSTSTGAVRISGGLGVAGDVYGGKVHGSVYNDYAEYRQSINPIEPGYIVYSGDNGILYKTVERLQFFEGVVSDTFGFSIGKTDKAQTPLAVAGRVLVYTDEELHAGDVVCAGPYGKACKMTNEEIKEHPDRIVGIVSEIPNYETWGEDNIPVNGRVWIRVK